MIRSRMVDAVVSTGANIVDQDFFEALGFKHYIAEDRLKAGLDDGTLRELHIDRIYDTLIDEDDLRVCDETTRQIADALEPRPYSSREFIREMGVYLERHGCKTTDSIVLRGVSRPTCRSSARRSATARPASASSPTSTPAATGPG